MTESAEVYLRLKARFSTAASHPRNSARPGATDREAAGATGESVPYGSGREPRGLGSVVDALTNQLGWRSPLARSELVACWGDLVGRDTDQHSSPVGISDGVLTVQCESTAWATQLRIMRAELLAHITERFPDAEITSIRFQGPDVPSWKRGPRSIPGRGPRDTYG